MTLPSRIRRILLPRWMWPSVTMQPAMLPTLRDLEHLADLDVPVQLLADFRLEHARERLLQVVEDLVNDAVGADFDVPLLGHRPRRFVGDDVEADDDGIGCIRQLDVALGDAADGGVNHADRAPRRCSDR